MSDMYVWGDSYHETSLGSIRANLYALGEVIQSTANSCVIDLTPPTFAGIATLTARPQGQFRVTWLAGTDANPPVRYEVYIQEATATGLFNTGNIVALTDKLLYEIFVTPDGTLLKAGSTYYVGVRAIDGVNNRESNTVSLSLMSSGISAAESQYVTTGAFSLGSDNKLYGTLWGTKNGVVFTGAMLGTASYAVYDKAGTLVVSEALLTADSSGRFYITPVTSVLNTTLEHYTVKVSIYMDKNLRENFVSMIEPVPEYEVHGAFNLNPSNQIIATFWVSADDELVSSGVRLGDASYTIYDSAGTPVGISESSISPDGNGLYKITPVTSTLSSELSLYSVKVTVNVDNVNRTNFLPILGKIPEYEIRGQFSINALNQFQATLWATVDGVVKVGSSLGVARYTVYDKDGIAVTGLTQSGISADVNGRFNTTPVTAALLTDLTHYSVTIGIVVDGIERISFRGFSLLGS